MTDVNDHLRAFVERIERLDEEAAVLNADRKEVYAEAKADGFNVKVMRSVIAARRQDPDDYREFQDLFDLYMHALGAAGTVVATRGPAHEVTKPDKGEGPFAGDDGSPSTPSEPDPAPSTPSAALTAGVHLSEGSQAASESMPPIPAMFRRDKDNKLPMEVAAE